MTVKPVPITRRAMLAALSGMAMSTSIADAVQSDEAHDQNGAILAAEAIADSIAAEDVSQVLTAINYDYCVARSQLNLLSHQTDSVILGRDATELEWRRVEKACADERALVMTLCAFPAQNDAERHTKASCLLAIFDGNEPSSTHVAAILGSMLDGAASRSL